MGFKTQKTQEIRQGRIIDQPGGAEKIKEFERQFKPFIGRKEEIAQMGGRYTSIAWDWELFLLDELVITYPEDRIGYTVVDPRRLSECLELRRGLSDLNERREYMRSREHTLYGQQ